MISLIIERYTVSRRLDGLRPDSQQVYRAMTRADRSDQDRRLPTLSTHGAHELVARQHLVDCKRTDAVYLMAAVKQRRSAHGLARIPHPISKGAHRAAHFPIARTARRRTGRGLDAVRGTHPVGKRYVAGVVGRRSRPFV